MSCLRNCEHRCVVGGVSCEEVCLDYLNNLPDATPTANEQKKPVKKTPKQKKRDLEELILLFQQSREMHRKKALEFAKRHKMDDLTLDPVQKRKLGIPTGRTFE